MHNTKEPYCCEIFTDQATYECDKHPGWCPDQVIKLYNDGTWNLIAQNAEYIMHYCPWCGHKLEVPEANHA